MNPEFRFIDLRFPKSLSNSNDDYREQPKKSISSINIPVDLAKEEKRFVKSWFTKSDKEDCVADDVVKGWIDKCNERAAPFLVHVAGYFEENLKAGYGVMIRDYFNKPIMAYSEYVKHRDSAFYHELQGVNKGLELAIGLGLRYVSMRCTSARVAMFVESHWRATNKECRCDSYIKVDVCLECLQNHYRSQGELYGSDVDKTNILMLNTVGLLQTFHRQEGEPVFIINAVEANNKSAAYIAEHGNGKGKMKLEEILENDKLLSRLFEEANIELANRAFKIVRRVIQTFAK